MHNFSKKIKIKEMDLINITDAHGKLYQKAQHD